MSHLLRISAVLALAGALQAQTPQVVAPTEKTDAQPPSAAPAPSGSRERDPLDLPPLPNKKVSLIGGTIVKLDPVLSRFTVQALGGKSWGFRLILAQRCFKTASLCATWI